MRQISDESQVRLASTEYSRVTALTMLANLITTRGLISVTDLLTH